MIISKCIDEKHIYTAWRENGERQFKLEAFEPYFFIEDDEFLAPWSLYLSLDHSRRVRTGS